MSTSGCVLRFFAFLLRRNWRSHIDAEIVSPLTELRVVLGNVVEVRQKLWDFTNVRLRRAHHGQDSNGVLDVSDLAFAVYNETWAPFEFIWILFGLTQIFLRVELPTLILPQSCIPIIEQVLDIFLELVRAKGFDLQKAKTYIYGK